MQTLEAIISLLILVMIVQVFLTAQDARLDTSLYNQQIANDAWRVLSLRGDFKSISLSSGKITYFNFDHDNVQRAIAENDLEEIGRQTGYCIFIGGERITNCRGEDVKELVTTEKSVFVNGNIQKVTLSLAIKEN